MHKSLHVNPFLIRFTEKSIDKGNILVYSYKIENLPQTGSIIGASVIR